MQDLGTLGRLSRAYSINARGQIVGESYTAACTTPSCGTRATAAGATRAFLWEARTGMQDLGTLGGDYSVAYGINARGQVVGASATAAGLRHAFLWEARTGMQDLGSLGGGGSGAMDINARGQVVGASATAAGASHAFLWEAGTGMQDLGALGGSWSSAFGINARGPSRGLERGLHARGTDPRRTVGAGSGVRTPKARGVARPYCTSEVSDSVARAARDIGQDGCRAVPRDAISRAFSTACRDCVA